MKRFLLPLLLATTLPAHQALAEPLTPTRYSDFSTYTLALSWQNGFCQSMSERGRKMPDECKLTEGNQQRPLLTVHGLWPSLPRSIASRGVDNRRWMRFGCATRPEPNFPEARGNKCSLPNPGLSPAITQKLAETMPGASGRSCLERYEYAKHGVCFGFNPNDYFATMARLSQQVNASPLGQWLAAHDGQKVSRADFNNVLADSFGKASLKAVKLTCHGNPSYLTEMQMVIDAKSINEPLSADSLVSQAHPGNCPKQFVLDAAGH
ncbi:ribonuclease I [Salmonella enterica subsp. enterica serovar Choleraesuis]|nr:ribonuclease I [Salmonella enterica subsp. enterica serovar Choleraesuis]